MNRIWIVTFVFLGFSFLFPAPLPSQTLESPQIWPHPFNIENSSDGKLRIRPVPLGSKVSVYSVDRRLVAHMEVISDTATWDGKSDSGRRVAPGVYFYVVQVGKTVVSLGRLYVKKN